MIRIIKAEKTGEEVKVEITRLPLQPGKPYEQRIVVSHGRHQIAHTITHDPANFHPDDTKREIERIIGELANSVSVTSEINGFLEKLHAEAAEDSGKATPGRSAEAHSAEEAPCAEPQS